MIQVSILPLIIDPPIWTLVFGTKSTRPWLDRLIVGKYKHVRAFAYVPGLHVWVFYDVHVGGTDIIVAADGEPAQRLIGGWMQDADLIRMPRMKHGTFPPTLGFCVPAIKRLIGLRSGALRPSALYRDCLANGGTPFNEAARGRTASTPNASESAIPAASPADAAAGR